ncbi:MAG: phosphotransferase [Acidimicrobiia bacterium]|nr:phosphotransferase [Acidimicrobiia bacterium]
MTTIPASIDEVTADWLTDVTEFQVDGTAVEQIGVGVGVSSALYRVRLRGPACPDSVIVKLPALDPAAVFTSTMLRMYIREVRFFTELARQSPVRVPTGLHAAVDEETSRFVVVMEDMGKMRVVDQVEGMSLTDAERAVDELAAWHATWWREADELAEAGVTVSLDDPIYPAVLPVVFAEGWEKLTAELQLPPPILDVGPRFAAGIPGLLRDLCRAPTTVFHGDYRADNILFAPDGSVVLLDFQLIGTGSGAYDLAYFITQSLTAGVAAEYERALFDRWTAGLLTGGVPADDLGRMWEDYRRAALFCLVYPVVASRGMDLADRRQRGLLDCMNGRFGRAVDQLDLASLI